MAQTRGGGTADTISANLRRLREKHSLTQDELAERSNIHRVTIAAIEVGRYGSPRITTLTSLAQAMGEKLEEFFRAPKQAGGGRAS